MGSVSFGSTRGVSPFTTSISGDVVTYAGSTGGIIADLGIPANKLVVGPGVVGFDNVPAFVATSGTALQDSGITAGSIVTGPGVVGFDNLPIFVGTAGNKIQDSGVVPGNLLARPSTPTSGSLVAYAGTGNSTIDTGIHVTSGYFTIAASHDVANDVRVSLTPGAFTSGTHNVATFNLPTISELFFGSFFILYSYSYTGIGTNNNFFLTIGDTSGYWSANPVPYVPNTGFFPGTGTSYTAWQHVPFWGLSLGWGIGSDINGVYPTQPLIVNVWVALTSGSTLTVSNLRALWKPVFLPLLSGD